MLDSCLFGGEKRECCRGKNCLYVRSHYGAPPIDQLRLYEIAGHRLKECRMSAPNISMAKIVGCCEAVAITESP